MICREPELCRVNALHNDDMRSRPCTNRCKCDADADATTATSHQRQRRTLSRRLVGQLRGCQPAAGRRAGERPAKACSRRPAGHDRQRRGPRQSLGDGDHWRQFSAASDRVRRTHRAREHTTWRDARAARSRRHLDRCHRRWATQDRLARLVCIDPHSNISTRHNCTAYKILFLVVWLCYDMFVNITTLRETVTTRHKAFKIDDQWL